MSRKRALAQGLELVKNGQLEEALETLNDAIRENNEDKNLLDSRAAVFEKLGRPLDALKDCKKVIHLAPSSCQGYLRSARLFLSIGKHEASLKMADLALERINSNDTKRRDELEEIRKHAVKALESQTCHFLRLPVELQIEIFTLIIGGSNSKMLALTRVCRTWRDLIIGTPTFWRHLSVGPKTALNKVDTWLHRSNDVLSSLRIVSGSFLEARLRALKNAGPNVWSSLDALDFDAYHTNDVYVLPEEYLQLKTLRLLFHSTKHVQELLRNVDMSHLRHFVLSFQTSECIRMVDLTSTTLTTLEVKCNFQPEDIRVILKRNPLLVKLILELKYFPMRPEDSGNSIPLVNLKHLEVHNFIYRMDLISNLFCPNLKVLHVAGSLGWVINNSLQVIESWPLTHLEYCILERCEFSSGRLISILQRVKCLKTLRLPFCEAMDEDEERVIEALARIPLCCPLLQHVDLSHSLGLELGPIVRLVKAHLPKKPRETDEKFEEVVLDEDPKDMPLPIISLNIDNTPLGGLEALPWLRANVPRFSRKWT